MNRHTVSRAPRALRASNDRWLFGYADVVTLLFACFASLYAAEAVHPANARPDVHLPFEAAPAPPPATSPLERELQAVAAGAVGDTRLEVAARDGGVVLSLVEAGSFPPGRAELTPAARRVMRIVGEALRRVPNGVRVEGHTDDDPVQNGLFRSNWELSTARATHVLRFLVEDVGLEPSRLSAAGYAEFRPRTPNDSPQARARNRRVDVVVLDVGRGPDEATR
ncbi:MAG: OmpA family protein [Acidobacteria bacterium]|nr:OmpA family protein [Acidobacteriota bacterium]